MFKRPKGVSEVSESETSDQDAPAPMRPVSTQTAQKSFIDQPADDTALLPPTKNVTPSYEARKPTVRTFQSPSTNATPAASAIPSANLHVGRGLKLEGKIQSCDTLMIEGDVKATIESGTLTISETGDVSGEATVDEAEINGRFDGTLTVKKCLTINSTGRVTGIVLYGELKVEQGGQVSGEIQAAGQSKVENTVAHSKTDGIDSSASQAPSIN
ncbi:MAG: hypothetical protein GC184_13120 [Rhizobiales bacterium]|nr:hypothetical protein [Hyphomicrobiales bacterium]